MAGYTPLKITGNQTGLVQEREEFILPDDAYPSLENAFVWRERIKRKQGVQLLGRLQRALTTASFGNITAGGAGTITFNIITGLITATSINASETNAQIVTGDINPITIAIGAPISQTLTDTTGTGVLTITGAGPITAATISYSTGNLIITFSGAAGSSTATITANYYPILPVMGARTEELANSAFDQTVFWDTVYAYIYNGTTFEEFHPGTTWTGSNSQFMWTTNYFIGTGNFKIFWATNNNDPIRYTNEQAGSAWINFAPIINAGGGTLTKALILLPFRGRLVALNVTQAGSDGGTFTNRIRWSAIGTPFTTVSALVSTVNVNAWRDDIRGQGGFLDIPTSEDIVAAGFVRDNLVIYCERSTWQLRYTGRTIAPFQIERVNSELGAESTFSAIQFDTSLVGIGDKGVVECDSYKSERIDIKIPDLVFTFSNANDGTTRVHGIRDFVSRLAYWTYPSETSNGTFPDKRLVYNYDNDSWAIFDDSFTCFGTFQLTSNRTWLNTPIPWIECNFTWIDEPSGDPVVVAGNQQGFIEIVGNQINGVTTNEPSLSINNITANTTTSTVITSINHNLTTGMVIEISGIIPGTAFANLNTGIDPNTNMPFNANNGVFGVVVIDADNFQLGIYNATTDQFSDDQLDVPPATPYIGNGLIAVRDNFSITSKKFNYLEEGQNIQMGYLDILMDATGQGAISLNVYVDYQDDEATNILPQNSAPDTFFNAIIPTSPPALSNIEASKYWQRVFCPTRGNFLTLEYKLSNSQMAGIEQTENVQIDAQILWLRRAGRLTNI